MAQESSVHSAGRWNGSAKIVPRAFSVAPGLLPVWAIACRHRIARACGRGLMGELSGNQTNASRLISQRGRNVVVSTKAATLRTRKGVEP